MEGAGKLPRRRLEPGETLVEQGAAEDDLFLLLDGVLDVEVDEKVVAQVGPGAMLGERAALEGGIRTATLRAVTACRLAVIRPDQISKYELTELALRRRREED
jgi:CRP-like cAMP-binding protein